MEPIVLSFYTEGTPYEEEAQKLIQSCAKFEIEADIVGLSCRGSWEKNCAIKPFFILEKLKTWKRPVFWVDADAVFLNRPDFSPFEACDFSVRINEFFPKNNPSRVVSNAIFARHTADAEAILEKWCTITEKQLNASDRTMEFWDQIALRDALELCPALSLLPMPLKFAKIFDFDDLFISQQEVIIEHYQASRRHKHVFSQNHCCR